LGADPLVSSRPVIEVRAEMAANVWQVLVEVGQRVAAGAELVILESMKMEIPVEAPVGATVAAVRVAPEDSVQEGDVLVVLDPA
jgi:acetyl-CoA carboxylase biotin carboxyl carrier protein